MADNRSLRYRNRLSLKNRLARGVWGLVWLTFFRPTPRWTLHGWRRLLLRLFGARIGWGCKVRPSCRVWAPWNLTMGEVSCLGDRVNCYNVAPVTIGSKATVSQDAFLCTATHDISTLTRELISEPITIGDHAWVAARAFVGPGAAVGEGAVVGACAVVTGDVEPWTVVAGSPARCIRKREIREP